MKTSCSTLEDGSRPNAAYPSFILPCAAAATFLGLLELLALSASLAGLRLGSAATGALAAVATLAAYIFSRALRPAGRANPPSGFKIDICGKFILSLTICLYLLLWWLAWTIPDFGWDGLHYHNPTIHSWAVAGRVHWIEVGNSPWKTYIDSFWNGIPKSVELSGFLLLSLTSLSRLLNALNLPLVIIGTTALYSLSRSLGSPPKTALPISTMFVAVPVVTAQCVTTYIDTGVAAFYLCVFALTVPTLRQLGQGVIPWKLLIPLGAAGGLALGAKGPGFAVPFLAGGFIILAGRKGRVDVPRLLRFFFLFLLIAFLVGGYWSIRALLHTGSPLYPVGLKIGKLIIFPGGWDYFPPPYTEAEAAWSQVHRIAVSWLNTSTDWNRIYSANYGGLGRIWLLGGLPATLLCLGMIFRRNRKNIPDRLTLLVLTGFCLPLFFLMPYNHNHKVRYTIWLLGMGLPCLSFLASQIKQARKGLLRNCGMIWLGLVILLGLGEGYYTFSRLVVRLDSYLAPAENACFSIPRLLKASGLPYRAGFRWKELDGSPFSYIFAGRETVALGELTERHELLVGHLTQGDAYGVRKIIFLDPAITRDQTRIRNYLRDEGIRFIIYEAGAPPSSALARLAILREQAGSLFRILVFQPDMLEGDNS